MHIPEPTLLISKPSDRAKEITKGSGFTIIAEYIPINTEKSSARILLVGSQRGVAIIETESTNPDQWITFDSINDASEQKRRDIAEIFFKKAIHQNPHNPILINREQAHQIPFELLCNPIPRSTLPSYILDRWNGEETLALATFHKNPSITFLTVETCEAPARQYYIVELPHMPRDARKAEENDEPSIEFADRDHLNALRQFIEACLHNELLSAIYKVTKDSKPTIL